MYKGMKIAVIGDFMTDYWYEPESIKLCPSFPSLSLINPELVSDNDGGAGNVAKCVEALGAECVLFSPTMQLEEHEKHYYMYQDRLLFRIDHHPPLGPGDADCVEVIVDRQEEFDGVIIADYNKGCMIPDTIIYLMDSIDLPIFVDPKFDNWEYYKGATVFKCNRNEANANAEDLELFRRSVKNLVITDGKNGMVVMGEDAPISYIPGRPVNAVDPTGAGDVCIAVIALEYLRTEDILKACHVANIAGSLVSQKKRVAQVTVDELRKAEAWDE